MNRHFVLSVGIFVAIDLATMLPFLGYWITNFVIALVAVRIADRVIERRSR